jgi:MFS family permease
MADINYAEKWDFSASDKGSLSTLDTPEHQDDISIINHGRPESFKSTPQEVLFVLCATMAIAMSSLLQGSVTVTSASIASDLHMTTAKTTWITAASSLAAGAFLLLFARLADLFGRRVLFIGSLFLFSVFALAAGFAAQPITLDVLNGVLGLFNSSAVPAAQGLLSISYPTSSKRRNYAFACFSAGNPLGFAAGALFGGVTATIFRLESGVLAYRYHILRLYHHRSRNNSIGLCH